MSDSEKQGISVRVDVYGRDDGLFRYEAADEVLRVLVDTHDAEFAIPELVDATGKARSTVWRAVDLLDDAGVVRIRETPQRNYVRVDPERLVKDDPVLAIDQPEFHDPVRAFLEAVQTAIADSDDVHDLLGVIVFGSVARGEADRRSDVDLFVVVEGNRTSARRVVADVTETLEERRFDGNRFAFESHVETAASATRAGEQLEEIFEDGIAIYGGDRLASLRAAVQSDE
ncbi:hypothetical protein GCM10028857_25060 [Salinarchaeum chitinilyticum]